MDKGDRAADAARVLHIHPRESLGEIGEERGWVAARIDKRGDFAEGLEGVERHEAVGEEHADLAMLEGNSHD